MKFSLPTENWNDVFGFMPRRQLGELVPQIGNWYFASKAQFYLHECGQITLAYLTIGPASINDDDEPEYPIVDVEIGPAEEDESFWDLPLADVLPTNVKNFKAIRIRFCDESVLNFLKEFQRNSLFHDVHLDLTKNTKFYLMLAFVTNILPLLTNIKSIDIRSVRFDIMDLWTKNGNELAKRMLATANFLHTDSYNLADDWLPDWFFTPPQDGMPRILRITAYNDDLIQPFIGQLKKDFLEAKKAVTFFIHFKYWSHVTSSVQSLTLDNGQTNEKLVIERNDAFKVAISRYPIAIGSSQEWIKGMREQMRENRFINIPSS